MTYASHWNYRVIQKQGPLDPFYEIHEVYYDENDKPQSVTENPVTVGGDSLDEIQAVLEMMLADVKKKQEILKLEDF